MKKSIRYSRMKQPPLIKQLKGILSEYPDGGQILKELIQNAEDAGAREVKILHDNRRINHTSDKYTIYERTPEDASEKRETIPLYTKFFKGPALCVYNDAVFTDNDWEGIQMIYSSVKEEDPMKVGRFGLGFKSVFHITDFPCVISGDRVLMIDPQQPTEKVNATLDLCALDDYIEEGMDAEAFWFALENTFGLCRNDLGEDGFQGTLFWFPLREQSSDLSETLYNETKVKNLFDSFASEASNILLFLKNIEKISLHFRDTDEQVKEVLRVAIDDKDGAVRKSRSEFKKGIGNLNSAPEHADIHSILHMIIHTSSMEIDKTQEWLVVNYFVRDSASEDFKILIQDTNLGYCPYVGVAMPLNDLSGEFEGHVFCFLPLPREGERLTGLPVHVNGFFALSQNRHHMKWETEEQEGKQIDDKSILWNKALLEEALPKAYELLVLEAINIAEKKSNDEAFVTAVYNAMPICKNSARKAHNRWMILEKKLYANLEKRSIAFATQTNEWITLQDACFSTFRTLPRTDTDVSMQEAVVRCLHKVGLKYAKFPNSLFDTVQIYFPYIKDLNPGSLVKHLRESHEYRQMSCQDKMWVLAYLLLDEENLINIKGLELLPLASERWTEFNPNRDHVYLCSDAAVKMFPGLENKLVMESKKLGLPLSENIERICKTEKYQIQRLNVEHAKNLMKEAIISHSGSATNIRLTTESSLTSQWLENVWQVLIDKNIVKNFKDIPLVPILSQGSWNDPHIIELVRLSDVLVIKESEDSVLVDGLCSCLKAMKVKVLPSLPSWIPFETIKEFVFRSTKEGIVSLLGAVFKKMGDIAVSEFNVVSQVNSQIREALVQFACTLAYFEEDVFKLFHKLRLFRAVQTMDEQGQYTAVADVPRYIPQDINFPDRVELPFRCIRVGRPEENILQRLEVEKISLESLLQSTIQKLLSDKNHDQISIFMKYFMQNVRLFESNRNLFASAAQLPFLTVGKELHKPSDLFDPSCSSLQKLLCGEALFPENYCKTSDDIQALRRLGLKGKDKIDASVMLQVANTLNVWSRHDQSSNDLSGKAAEFMDVLVNYPNLLDRFSDGTTRLYDSLMTLSCIPVMQNPPADYPEELPWFSREVKTCKPGDAKGVEWSLLVGAKIPVVECTSDRIVQLFKWNVSPKVDIVLQQLGLIRHHYNVKNKPDYMRTVQRTYRYLNRSRQDISIIENAIKKEGLVWTGFGFEFPGKIIINKQESDLDLLPYFCNLPEEIQDMADLFQQLGCHPEQNRDILLNVLQSIKVKYESSIELPESSVTRDSDIVLEILKVLAARRKAGSVDIDESEMLMLVQNDSSGKLCLQYVSDCIFDDDQDELDEEEKIVYIVSDIVPDCVAKHLGVKSLKRKTLLGATEKSSFTKWGQHESVTTRIGTLLRDGYKDGLSVPKEVVQNADDAGATVVKLLYDERSNKDAKKQDKLFTSDLREYQGPALWVYNDSQFTENDLKNIKELGGATKADKQDKIGKFGLGFCSVYNLTDVPSFISGKDMVIFDPHETYIQDILPTPDTGLHVKLSKRLIRSNQDQFKPYNAVFGCNVLDPTFTVFNGTLFRLPLRTEHQAAKSDICKEAYTKEEVSALLSKFIENAGNILLFTQNVKALQVYHLSKDETDPSQAKLLFNVVKEIKQFTHDVTSRNAPNVLKRIPTVLKNNENFNEIHHVEISQTFYESKFLKSNSEVSSSVSVDTNWIVSWALGTNESLRLSKRISDKGAVPLSAVAVPVKDVVVTMPVMLNDVPSGFYKKGHLFCFLPLPITTDLPFHVNGCFSVTSDRKGLLCFTEDDKRKGENDMWNQVLMEDSLVQSYMYLLMFMSKQCSDSYSYYSLWPLAGSEDVHAFKRSFYKTLVTLRPKLFRGAKDWLSVDELVFLDPDIRSNDMIGDTAFEFLSLVPARKCKIIIEIPGKVLASLQDIAENSIFLELMIKEEELLIHFLSTLDSVFWHHQLERRNKLILFALQTKSENVLTKLQETKCIPSEPNNVLCRPNELICPTSELADMFDIADGKFPLQSESFCESEVIAKLISLGMNNKYLPKDMLLQRCKSVEDLHKICGSCAQERCARFLKYCGNIEVTRDLESDTDTLNKLAYTLLVPVLQPPSDWKFTWKGDTLEEYISNVKCEKHFENTETSVRFEKPVKLFRQSLYICTGSICAFIHEGYLKTNYAVPERILNVLGVKGEVTVEILLQQLKLLSDQYTNSQKQFHSLEVIFRSVLEWLAQLIGDKSQKEISEMSPFLNLKETPLIIVGKELIMPCKLAFRVKAECPPELYCLREADFKRLKIFKALGVVDHFSVAYIISALKRVYTRWNSNVCKDIETVSLLLLNLCSSMEIENVSYEHLKEDKASIIAPDTDGFLRPTNELVIEDPAYKFFATLHILHGNISPDTGRTLGVKSKQRRIVECFSSGFFTPFGQNESLVTRLTGILEDYPCDASILKELIQNADDAGASEIHFIKNYDTHVSKQIFGGKELQGPALCVFNDSYFTEKDFNGIRSLGIGSKREDPSKTGQYGIGFNAVYHLTDVPSFLTKGPGLGNCGQICIFDPLMTYLEGYITKDNPGIKCDVESMKESFPDMLLGYPENLMEESGQGTMFRLPLRQVKSDISKHVVSVESMDTLLEECKQDIFECMFFLKSVRCIKVSSYSNGKLSEEYALTTELSEEAANSRQKFFSDVKEIVDANLDIRHNNFNVQPLESSYTLTVLDNNGRNEDWLIVNRFGIEQVDEKYESLVSAFKDKTLGLLPIASVALHLPQNDESNYNRSRKGKPRKAFCFLPLPVETGLPLHVNGHFALDKPRSKLWNEGIRKCWNEFVIEELITRAWISAMHCLKRYLFQDYTLKVPNIKICSAILETYNKHFPLWKRAGDDFWRCLVSSFYSTVIENESKIFPSCDVSLTDIAFSTDKIQDLEEPEVAWVSLSKSENDFHGTFNSIKKALLSEFRTYHRTDIEESILIENTLKKLGMKIVETPMNIYESMKQAKIEYIPMCSPTSVVEFLKTFSETDDNSCQLGGIDIPLSETAFSDVRALESLIRFARLDEKFKEKLNGLPLCLTNDGILRTFKIYESVYCSEMCDVLTGSASRFIHSKCVFLTDQKEFYESGVIKPFEIDDFVSCITETFDRNTFASGTHVIWDKENGKPLKPQTIEQIYKYIYNKSLHKKSYITTVDHQLFQSNVRKFNDWAFFPSCNRYGSQTTFELVPIRQTYHMLCTSHGSETINQILLKLNIPTLESSLFLSNAVCLISPLQKMLPSAERPFELLECLLHYKMKLQSASLSSDECLTVLSYFDNNLETLKQRTDAQDLNYKLKRLPLFVASQEEVTSIENYQDVIVLPHGIISEGIDVWAEQTGILLLKKTDKLQNLYDFLHLPRMSELDVYIEKILPNINFLPRENWMSHFEFIKDNLLTSALHQTLNNKQKKMVGLLKHVSFIKICGKYRKANELYDCNNSVFSSMLTADYFLPEEYRGPSWSHFMELLGLVKQPTDEMMINFALKIERNICSPISDLTRRQSDALVESLFNRSWEAGTLHRIKGIRFVVPHKVNSERQNVCKQPGNGETLVCFSRAVFYENNTDYCWSNLDLLPYVPLSEEMWKDLEIYDFPPIDKIVKHCQNVSDVLKTQLEGDSVKYKFVKFLMEKLYRVLMKYYEPSMKQSFQVTPIIFHSEDNIMLTIKEVVVNLNEEEEVKPYLYKLPNCFGAYEDLFVKLGSHKSVVCSHYSNVLESIRQQYRDLPIPPNCLSCVRKAIENIVRLLEKESEPLKNVRKFYIPDRNLRLAESRTLTVSNNIDIEERIEGKLDLNFFLGFRELEIDSVSDPELPFLLCPEEIRPDILTDVVMEEVSTDDMHRKDSLIAQRVESFFRSPNFVEGVLRLVKHQMKLHRKYFEKKLESKIMSRLTNVKISEATGLKTFLNYKGNKVDGTDRNTPCFIKSGVINSPNGNEIITNELFFQVDGDDDIFLHLIEEQNGLVQLIDRCTDGILEKDLSKHLTSILRMQDNSSKIKQKLDKLRIAAYDLPDSFASSIFPRPGTYVEEKFHAFLEQSIFPFKTHEYMYAALEVENDDDADDMVYIYVNIICENRRNHGDSILQITYSVDVGHRNDECITVPLYRLYKFKPQRPEEVNALVKYDIEPIGSIPLDENFRRVRQMLTEAWSIVDKNERERVIPRVIRRLLTRWHPDRNRDHREYAERLFNYVKEVVIQLEKNGTADDLITDGTGRLSPDMSGSLFGPASSAAYSRGCRYAAAFHDNMDDYNRSTRTGKFTHYKAEDAVVRHVGEAKRWHRQAVQDFKAAECNVSSGEETKSFNWVCYKCHQASEKALKAAWFAKNANRANMRQHSLTAIASGLDDGAFMAEASSLEGVTGDYSSMRYPDAVVGRHQIPSEMFDSTKAQQAIQVTKRILEMAAEFID